MKLTKVPPLTVNEAMAIKDALLAEYPKAESLELIIKAWELGYKRALTDMEKINDANPKSFETGEVVTTMGIVEACEKSQDFKKDLDQIIGQYKSCNWGDTESDDKVLNDQAVINGEKIVASYNIGEMLIFIETEADRSQTKIMLDDEI